MTSVSQQQSVATGDAESLFFEIPTLSRVHVRRSGNGRQACVLIHGFGDGAFVWDEFARAAAPQFRMYAIDLRGHGQSSWAPLQTYTTTHHVMDVRGAIERLGLDTVTIVGHSWGACVGIHLAAIMPGRVRKLVIVDFGVETSISAGAHAHNIFKEQFRPYADVAEYTRWLAETRPAAQVPVLERLAAAALRETANGFELRCDPALADVSSPDVATQNLMPTLSCIACPTLVVRGGASAVLSTRAAELTRRHLRMASVAVISGAGHAVMIDNPTGFNSVVHSYLAQVTPDAGLR